MSRLAVRALGATPSNPRWLKAGRLLSRHRWFAAAAAGGLVLRVLTMLAFPPAIWFGGDSASYLSTALRHAPGTSRLSGYGLLLLVPVAACAGVMNALEQATGENTAEGKLVRGANRLRKSFQDLDPSEEHYIGRSVAATSPTTPLPSGRL